MTAAEILKLPVTRQSRVMVADRTIRTVLCLLVLCLSPFPIAIVHGADIGSSAAGELLDPQDEAKVARLLSPVRVPETP
jgi:hypothetical protein